MWPPTENRKTGAASIRLHRELSTLLRGSLFASTFGILAACSTSPVPLTGEEIVVATDEFVQKNSDEYDPINGPIDIRQAVERSVKFNLDYRIEAAQNLLRVREHELTNIAMLPELVASGGYNRRNNFSASSSLNLQSGVDNFSASTSQDKAIRSSDIQIGWDILDFGLSYIRAKQAADQTLIAHEVRRKVLHRLIANVTTVFGRALTLQRLTGRLDSLKGRLREAIKNADAAADSQNISRAAALLRRRELLDLEKRIAEIKRTLVTAKADLAALMNVDPMQEFELSDAGWKLDSAMKPPSVKEAVALALLKRPEIRENIYQYRINAEEATAAMLELLPGIKLSSSSEFDSNSFLLNNNWAAISASAAGNLVKLFAYPANKAKVELQGELLRLRGRAVVVAISVQVHASYARYAQMLEDLRIAGDYRDVQKKLLAQLRSEADAQKVSQHLIIREELNYVIACAQYDEALTALAEAVGAIKSSIGEQGAETP